MDSDTAWELLRSQPVAVLATIGADGSPHLVPFVFAATEGRTLVSAVDAKPKRSRSLRRLENIRRDPRVTVLAHHYDIEDWSRLWWVRAEGTATITESSPPGSDLLEARYPQYADQELGPWIVIEVDHLTGWQAA